MSRRIFDAIRSFTALGSLALALTGCVASNGSPTGGGSGGTATDAGPAGDAGEAGGHGGESAGGDGGHGGEGGEIAGGRDVGSGGAGGAGGVDPRPGADAGPGADAAVVMADRDDDGVPDAQDNCPDAANHTQRDRDRDGKGDACDRQDTDGDGRVDGEDPCPAQPDDGLDTDGDGWGNACDTCPVTPDPDQIDADGDGIGDACEVPGDDDADGLGDARDNCVHRFNPDQADPDRDGRGSVCDLCPDAADPDQLDRDGDGLGDACDVCPDAPPAGDDHADLDGDGVARCAGDCDDLDPLRAPTLPERCNARDDDCDLAVDEDFVELGAPCAAGEGLCREGGLFVCGPAGEPVCNAVPHPPQLEACNGVDDDCDGSVDDGTVDCCQPGEFRACGSDVGLCAAGTQRCDAGFAWGACEGAVEPGAERCNGADDDCDGQTDEGLGSDVCGQGVCRHEAPLCVGGEPQRCEPFEGASPEVCNGLDDDCDGETDDGIAGLGAACAAGTGECRRDGVQVCREGGVACNAVAGQPQGEVCDGRDNDCDGVADNGVCLGTGSCDDPFRVPAEGIDAVYHIGGTSYVGATCNAVRDGVDQIHVWTAPRAGLATFRYVGDFWPAFLAVRDGGCHVANLACDYQAGQWPTNQVQLQVQAGRTYYIVVGHGAYTGPIVLTYTLTVTPP